jgi:hypothetical protein
VFLNNDMRVEPAFLRELVAPIVRGECQATTGKMLSWDGKLVNSAGGGMNFHGLGIQIGLDDTDLSAHRQPGETLFACGGAMVVERELFLAAGGFDEHFFAYYEDVDLGWRLWVLGERIRFVPSSVAYHHHSATSVRIDLHKLRLLQIRNPLQTIFKNYDDENLRRVLPAALLLTLRRTKYQLTLNEALYSLKPGGGQKRGPLAALRVKLAARLNKARVSRAGLADVLAINELLDDLPGLIARRRAVQDRRLRPDAEIIPLFREPFWPAEAASEYAGIQSELVRFLDLQEVLG